jgi:hypothetical protein
MTKAIDGAAIAAATTTLATGSFSGQVTSNGRKIMDQYAFGVCVSTPYSLGTSTFTICSIYFPDAVTVTTMTVHVVGGTNTVLKMTHRATTLADSSDGTNMYSGDITAVSSSGVWVGGSPSDFTIPANSAIAFKIISTSGDVDRLIIKGLYTKD